MYSIFLCHTFYKSITFISIGHGISTTHKTTSYKSPVRMFHFTLHFCLEKPTQRGLFFQITVHFALCISHFALCFLYFAFCTLYCALCISHFALFPHITSLNLLILLQWYHYSSFAKYLQSNESKRDIKIQRGRPPLSARHII